MNEADTCRTLITPQLQAAGWDAGLMPSPSSAGSWAELDALKRLQAETAAELDALLPALLDRAYNGEWWRRERRFPNSAR